MRRVRKRFKPPDRNPLAVKRYPDGREVCMQNDAGRAEYKARKMRMWQRQNGLCSLCPFPVSLEECQFEHAEGRGMGAAHRDDRVVDENGTPMNSVCHPRCNSKKGSKHYQAPVPHGFNTDDGVEVDAGIHAEA